VKSFGQVIRERREELDLSLREFSKLLDCSAPFISDLELGRRFPSENTLTLIASVLKLDLEELKKSDPRPPLEEMKRKAEQDPVYAFAFRTLVNSNVSADEIIKLVNANKTGAKERPKTKK